MTTRNDEVQQEQHQYVELQPAVAPMGCEEVLLPGLINANGSSGQVHYIAENDPMAVILADIASIDANNGGATTVPHQTGTTSVAHSEEPICAQQLPKKRKNAIADLIEEEQATAEIANPIETPIENGTSSQLDESNEELPTSSGRLIASKENAVDPEQCRVCTSKGDLISLFNVIEKQTIAEMLMTICPAVSIAVQDFMPQYICNPCLDNVTIAIHLKQQCEQTETELRKKLSRGKNKVRRPTGYIVIDAPVESDPPSDEEEPNDDEFKVSASEVSSSSTSDDEDSVYGYKKKKHARSTGGKRGRRKSTATTTTPASEFKEKRRPGRPPLKRTNTNMYNDNNVEEICINANGQIKRIRRSELRQGHMDEEFPCDECPQVFKRKISLKLHKKAHKVRDPIQCEVCGKEFRVKGAYRTHVERHANETNGHKCDRCGRIMSSRADLKRHMADEHGEEGLIYECDRCGRSFVTVTRLQKHQMNRCPGYIENKHRRPDLEGYAVGKDLFRTVAPVTTTYWSDSFSE